MGELGRIAGVSVPGIFDPDTWKKSGEEVGNFLNQIGFVQPGGYEGSIKIGGQTLVNPFSNKKEAYVEGLLDTYGIKSEEDRAVARDSLKGINDAGEMRKYISRAGKMTTQRKQRQKEAKAEAEAIDQKQFSRQTGLMDRSFGYQKQLEALNAANELKRDALNATNNLRLEDKRGQYGLANQRLANEGNYRVNDLTSRRSLEGTKYSADAQVRASRLNALAGMLTPRETAFRGTGMKGLG